MRNNETPARVLPADVYDALELSVLASEGSRIIGGPGRLTCGEAGCLLAHAAFLDGVLVEPTYGNITDGGWDLQPGEDTPVLRAVWDAFGADRPYHVYSENDNACGNVPLTWEEYTAKLGIVRGDA